MNEYYEEFYGRMEGIVSDIDDVLEDYQILEFYDVETEISEAREILSDILYKISRM